MNDTAQRVYDHFQNTFATEPHLYFSPGRVNLIGEHTDYNDGFVLPAAIDKGIYLAILPTAGEPGRWISLDFNEEVTPDLTRIAPLPQEWANYVLGVIDQFQKGGHTIAPFHCVIGGNLPVGAGLSSSAALESVVAYALTDLNELDYDRPALALLAQRSENQFIGVQCGIMDMFASLMGRENQVIRLDCRSLDYQYFPLHTEGLRIVLFDTGVKHSLAGTEYNLRRQECEAGVAHLQQYDPSIKSLRDVSLSLLEAHRGELDPVVYKRCKYVVEEIARTLAATDDLQRGDLASFGTRMFETHAGLQYDYEVSCPELDLLVELVKQDAAVIGARMMGGGFGGCTINLVREEAVEALFARLATVYEEKMGRKLAMYNVTTADGSNLQEVSAPSVK
ncbi:galactokinase [Catalinimonas alkaloidigena]|uniref:Galactokinase n=1 Tax=Catalinimonas alkaloidigena TaxID=1075417 RepID=A0A1G9A0Q8_9BACT|nr:galactokinase [Catalinimonas alkaloidigena]SDK20948.1 galactokinase [Catalinimonas alkaloidigena]